MPSSALLNTAKTGKFRVLALPGEQDHAAAASRGDDNDKRKQQQQRQRATTQQNKKNEEQHGGATAAVAAAAGNKKKKKGQESAAAAAAATQQQRREWTADMQADYDRILSVGEECINAAELKRLIQTKGRGSDDSANKMTFYDGFEPSGRMHIAQGVFKAVNVNKCCAAAAANAVFVFWVADWFALMNDKMGGDLSKIQTVGSYLQEVWKAAGMELRNVVFKWASREITEHAAQYWPIVLDVASKFNVTRIKKCCQIMGRLEGSLTAAQVLYPLMQCADVFFLRADVCQLGVDQRKVNMLAREYCDAAKMPPHRKPVVLSHHMLYGLKAGQAKMSKSDPDSAIFMEDSAADVERKIAAAYCPSTAAAAAAAEEPQNGNSNNATADAEDAGRESLHLTEDDLKNPCLDYIEHIVMSPEHATFTAAQKTYRQYGEVRDDFCSGRLSEQDLKRGLIDALNGLLEPVRRHFETDERAKRLLETVRSYKRESQQQQQHDDDEGSSARRLNLVQSGLVPAKSHLVFAPVPSLRPTLQEAVDVLARLRAAAATSVEGQQRRPVVLYLSDWSARVCNACHGDAKAMEAYYTVLVTALRALDDGNVVMNDVRVVKQSDAILSDPSNYWISVINVGRHFQLDTVQGKNNNRDDFDVVADSDCVGAVVARLMTVADVAAVEPASLAVPASSSATERELVTEFFRRKLPKLQCPAVIVDNDDQHTSIRLQPARDSEALRQEHDEYYLLDDPKAHGKSKMKKAFCEPGNVTFCPPIAVAATFAFDGGGSSNDGGSSGGSPAAAAAAAAALTVKRSPENGGDVEYRTAEELESSFRDGKLHPGDLKTAAAAVMVSVLERLSSALKEDKDAARAVKVLKAAAKKANAAANKKAQAQQQQQQQGKNK